MTNTERELMAQNEYLLDVLQKVVNRATGTMGVNSLDREYCHITQNVLDLGREALRKAGRETSDRPTVPFVSTKEMAQRIKA